MAEIKTNFKQLINPDYLGSYSLDNGNGGYNKKVVFINKIENRAIDNTKGKKEIKQVAILDNEKPMILNKTAQSALQRIFKSRYLEDMYFKPITLYVLENQSFKVTPNAVDVLRVDERETVFTKPYLYQANPNWNVILEALKSGKRTIADLEKIYIVSDNIKPLLK